MPHRVSDLGSKARRGLTVQRSLGPERGVDQNPKKERLAARNCPEIASRNSRPVRGRNGERPSPEFTRPLATDRIGTPLAIASGGVRA